ncbi:MAG: isoprenylcysteine carboxylmethyltransferase family protein, partial [Verrucomicrobiales bacterium]|nr:isoprenylcysteine carboxylmethyltransferase family protein [Verrucomicrobiales bacterium]
ARKTADVSKEFFHRGGLWVLGQSVLLLAVAALGFIGRGEPKHILFLLGGLVFLAAGAFSGIAGVATLGRSLTPFPKPNADAKLVQHGIYRLIRHPLYTSVFCASVGWSLIWQSWPALAVSLLLALFFDAKARHEERWLRQQFPDYARYEQRVRRFIPWIY